MPATRSIVIDTDQLTRLIGLVMALSVNMSNGRKSDAGRNSSMILLFMRQFGIAVDDGADIMSRAADYGIAQATDDKAATT